MSLHHKVLLPLFKAVQILYLLLLFVPVSQGYAQGLLFNSNDSLVSKRTSYLVFKNDIPTFNDQLRLKFDLSLWDNEHLGYIFSITDARNNSYSLSFLHTDTTSWLNFNIDSRSNKIKIPLDPRQLKKRRWMKVSVAINLKGDQVTMTVNGKTYRAAQFGFDQQISPRIIFGRNERYSEVPNMAVRNLEVSGTDADFSFPLNEWSGNSVHNAGGDELGEAANPVWLINESYFWTPRFSQRFDEVAGLNYHAGTQQLFIFGKEQLYKYDTETDRVSQQVYQNPFPMIMMLGKSIVNEKENRLYTYEVNRPKEVGGPNLATLDLNTLHWDTLGKALLKEQRHHHNIFYDYKQDQLFLFGGYGSFAYYNNFFTYNRTTDQWDKVIFSGDTIQPRFFSGYSRANAKNEVYIFGGYGNETGSQVIGGKNFYDLYRVNLSTHTVTKCWEIANPEKDFVPANNLVLSADQQYFYALCYAHSKPKTTLRLYKFAIKDGTYEIVSGTIPVVGEKIESDINLFYNPLLNEFFCAVQQFNDDKHSVVRIYSLYAPPISKQAYLSAVAKNPASEKSILRFSLLLLALAGAAAAGFFWFIRKTSLKYQLAGSSPEDEEPDLLLPADEDQHQDSMVKKNAVYLLGEFTVYDKNSRDITYLFSPKIRQLFVLILLNSRNGIGISSKKISAVLWPDKDIAKTKNIKGVTINHLRNAIADIGGLELTFFNDTYCFQFQPDFSCDYFVVSSQLFGHHEAAQTSYLPAHFHLIARGGLLQSIAEPWLDDFKLSYEEALLNVILPELKRVYEARELKKALDISRVILSIDPFNDEAIKFRLKAFRRTKGIVHAQKIYDEFSLDYKKSLGVVYPVAFNLICSGDQDK